MHLIILRLKHLCSLFLLLVLLHMCCFFSLVCLIILTDHCPHTVLLRGFPERCPPLRSTMLPLPVFLEYCQPGTLYKPFWGLRLLGPSPLWDVPGMATASQRLCFSYHFRFPHCVMPREPAFHSHVIGGEMVGQFQFILSLGMSCFGVAIWCVGGLLKDLTFDRC